MLSGCYHNRLYTADSLRSKYCPTIEISIIEILLEQCIETLCYSLIPPRREPHVKLNKPRLANLSGYGGPQVKVYH